jgi:hypothetical protein
MLRWAILPQEVQVVRIPNDSRAHVGPAALMDQQPPGPQSQVVIVLHVQRLRWISILHSPEVQMGQQPPGPEAQEDERPPRLQSQVGQHPLGHKLKGVCLLLAR